MKERDFELNALTLHNQQATKPAIVEAFRHHLAKAAKRTILYSSIILDTVLANTPIQKYGRDQSNGRLEALACFYDHGHSPSFILTDKELRFLIHELYEKTKAHIVTIFDCCHSGDNTREMKKVEVQEKRVDFVFPKREWKDFIFSDKLGAK